MRKIKPEKLDINFIKSFVLTPDAIFVRELSLEMDVDYLMGLCMRFLDKDSTLEHKIIEFNSEQKRNISNYLNQYGTIDEKIYYLKFKTAYLTLLKYYNEDGTAKI